MKEKQKQLIKELIIQFVKQIVIVLVKTFVFLLLLLFIFYIAILLWSPRISEFGHDYVGSNNIVAKRLMDSIDNGIKRYYNKYKKYPNLNDKYFLNNILEFVKIDEIYLFADTIDVQNNDTLELIKKMTVKYDSNKYNYIYAGIGKVNERNKNIIKCKIITQNNYQLYYTGENGIDENGKGDDINHKGN